MPDKRPSAKTKPEANPTQESFNQLYTAHQVHTLAQFLIRRVSAGWNPMSFGSAQSPRMPWAMRQGPGEQPFVPHTPPGVIYWYS